MFLIIEVNYGGHNYILWMGDSITTTLAPHTLRPTLFIRQRPGNERYKTPPELAVTVTPVATHDQVR